MANQDQEAPFSIGIFKGKDKYSPHPKIDIPIFYEKNGNIYRVAQVDYLSPAREECQYTLIGIVEGNRYEDPMPYEQFKQWIRNNKFKPIENPMFEYMEDRIRWMNHTFELEVNYKPTSPPVERLYKFRDVLRDELDEIEDIIDSETQIEAIVKLSDLLGDLLVYVLSECCRWGIPIRDVFHAIMDSQESKLVDGKPLKAPDNSKFIKGPNYVPPEPEIERIIREA